MSNKVCDIFHCEGARMAGIEYSKEFYAGIECEIEAVKGPVKPTPNFDHKEDGSLRNSGVEFISCPLQIDDLMNSFKALHQNLKLGDDPFSYRTSTHVHVNIASLTMEQARTMVLLYALFEECFFMMVKSNRRDNIHCVPLTETALPSKYKLTFDQYVKHWSKYTALNLKRAIDLGTMEFRHLHGTNDVQEFEQWLCTLRNLWTLAQEVEINENTLAEEYVLKWFDVIFKDVPKVLQIRPSLFEVIRNNLIDVKFSI